MRVSSLLILAMAGCGGNDIGLGLDPTGTTAEPTPDPTGTTPDPDPTTAPPTPSTDPEPGDPPVARCSVSEDEVRPFTEPTTLDGSNSFDPAGLDLVDYDWQVVAAPAGSSVTVPGSGPVRDGFTVDQVGLYTASLVVTNSAGVESEPCEVLVEGVVAESLWVEMFWDQAGDDMDLHLIRPGGTFGDSASDCFYQTCDDPNDILDWGVANFADDDPFLDQDDLQGLGPENINMLSPTPGTYIVAISDFGSDPSIASTSVTVNVYVDGVLAFTNTRDIYGDPSEVEIAEIDWPAGQVTVL